MHLQKTDYREILRFIDLIPQSNEDPRRRIIDALSLVFGYQKATFWLADQQGNLYDPVINIDEKIVESYLAYYQQVDPFHPHNMERKPRKAIIDIKDLMALKDYEKCEYFRDFMRRFNLYHEIVMLVHDGDLMIGGMAVLRSADEGSFGARDMMRLEVLLRYISKSLENYLYVSDLSFQKNLFEAFSNHSSTGLMLFDQNLKLQYSNPSAREYILDLTPKEKGAFYPELFIKSLLSGWADRAQGVSKTVFSSSSRMYSVHVLPSLNGERRYYTVQIKPGEIRSHTAEKASVMNTAALTKREQEVLELVFKGCSNDQIAQELYVSNHTVKTHLHNIYKKCGTNSRAGLFFKYRI